MTELEDGLRIGTDLEHENRIQGEMFYRVAKAAAIATSRRDAAYQAVKEVEAEAFTRVRNGYRPEDKMTEAALKAEARTERDVVAAHAKHLALIEEAAVLSALERSYDKRSYALRDLGQREMKMFFQGQDAMKDDAAERIRATANDQRRRREDDRRDRGRSRDQD